MIIGSIHPNKSKIKHKHSNDKVNNSNYDVNTTISHFKAYAEFLKKNKGHIIKVINPKYIYNPGS